MEPVIYDENKAGRVTRTSVDHFNNVIIDQYRPIIGNQKIILSKEEAIRLLSDLPKLLEG